MQTKIRCRVDSVGFPTVGEIDAAWLAGALCWSPTGEGVAKVWSALEDGSSVEVASGQIPRQRADRAEVTIVTIYPLQPGEDGRSMPASATRVVRFAGAESEQE